MGQGRPAGQTLVLQGRAEVTDEPAAAILKLRIVGNSQCKDAEGDCLSGCPCKGGSCLYWIS